MALRYLFLQWLGYTRYDNGGILLFDFIKKWWHRPMFLLEMLNIFKVMWMKVILVTCFGCICFQCTNKILCTSWLLLRDKIFVIWNKNKENWILVNQFFLFDFNVYNLSNFYHFTDKNFAVMLINDLLNRKNIIPMKIPRYTSYILETTYFCEH